VIDMFEEARGVELGAAPGQRPARGHFRSGELARAATTDGHASLGWPDAGEIAEGAIADLVTVGLDSTRLAGATTPRTAWRRSSFAASRRRRPQRSWSAALTWSSTDITG